MHLWVQLPPKAKRGCWIPGAVVTDGCEQPGQAIENQNGSLQEQQAHLTAEQSPSPLTNLSTL